MCWVSVGRFASGGRRPLKEALLLLEIEKTLKKKKKVALHLHPTQVEAAPEG